MPNLFNILTYQVAIQQFAIVLTIQKSKLSSPQKNMERACRLFKHGFTRL